MSNRADFFVARADPAESAASDTRPSSARRPAA